jgi:hypothetical protein
MAVAVAGSATVVVVAWALEGLATGAEGAASAHSSN